MILKLRLSEVVAMGLIYTESFDVHNGGSAPAVINPDWVEGPHVNMQEINTTGGRRSTPCYELYRIANANPFYGFIRLNLDTDYETLYVGFAYYANDYLATPASHWPFFGWLYGNNWQCCLYVDSTGKILVYDAKNGSEIGTSAVAVVSKTQWQYWETKIYIHPTNGTLQIKLDGTTVINLTGLDTQTWGTGGCSVLHWSNMLDSAGSPGLVDDVIVFDDQGATFNDFMNDVPIMSHFPHTDVDADWNSTQVDHHDSVNVVGAGYGTDYIDSTNETDQDSFNFTADVVYPSVHGVKLVAYCNNNTGGTAKIKPYVRISGIVYYGDELTLPAGTDAPRSYVWETNPATGTLWSRAVIDAADWGFEVSEIS
jgi:hypothetical protein